ncbi:DUF4242 domain-containing protein [Flavobacteriaceae bacterium 3-367]
MKTINLCQLVCVLVLFSAQGTFAQEQQSKQPMKTFVIEREIPNAGNLSEEELKGISQKSNEVLAQMGPGIQWMHSYVTHDKVYCVYRAKNKEAILEHAKKGGFPANAISEMATKIGPETGN